MNQQSDQQKTQGWSGAFREQIIWFVFAVLLAGGASYINTTQTTTKIDQEIVQLQRRIANIEKKVSKNSDNTSEIRVVISRMEQKIDNLLELQGYTMGLGTQKVTDKNTQQEK